MYEAFRATLHELSAPSLLLVVLASAAYGIFVGAVPGLTATMAVALLVPFTFFMDDMTAIAAIVTTVTCSIFAGDIPGALLRIPGTPASAAYTLDAYAMTRRGQSGRSLGISLIFSIVGGLLGLAVLATAAPQLARIEFSPYEYFWMCVMGLSCAAAVAQESRAKGLLALTLGLLISTVGVSPDHGVSRFDMGLTDLYRGVKFIPAMIGLFGISEVLRSAMRRDDTSDAPVRLLSASNASFAARWLIDPVRDMLGGVPTLLWRRKWHAIRSSMVGAFIGMLPGAGADLAAWISYAVSKRLSPRPHEYGYGSEEGLSDATTANNASLAGAWIPALVFGIPGDSVTAIALGVLLMKNIEPGPRIFTDPSQQRLVWGVALTFLLANLILLPIGLVAIRAGTLLVRAPRRLLLPIILLFCVLGAYSIDASFVDVWIMLAMGLIGFGLEAFRIPLGPIVLGIILGGEVEHRFIQSLQSSDSWTDFVSRPVSAALALACVALWAGPSVGRWLFARRSERPA